MCYFNFLPFLFIFQSKIFRIPFIFSLFLQKIIFVFFPKREEINERNCYGIFYTFSLILNDIEKRKIQIK